MKKYILAIAIFFAILDGKGQAQQYDTLPYNVGVPQFFMKYHFDSARVIVDNNGTILRYPEIVHIGYKSDGDSLMTRSIGRGNVYGGYSLTLAYDAGDYALAFYPDSALTLIGVAWCDESNYINTPYHSSRWSSTYYDSIEVRLYIPENEDMILQQDIIMSCDSFVFSRLYNPRCGWDQTIFYNTMYPAYSYPTPVYEVYFENELTIADSFYFSVKYLCAPYRFGNNRRYDFTLGWAEGKRINQLESRYPVQNYRVQQENGGPWRYGEIHCYPLLFPIIRRACDTCPEIQGLRWSRLGSGTTAFVQWDAGANHRDWQLCYGPAGTPAGEGTVVDCPIAQSVLSGMAAGHQYDVYVRARCRFARDEWTGWSGPLEIGFGNPGEGIDEAAGVYAELTPNPATWRVRVSCGEALRMVEVYDLQGRRMLAQEASGTTLDLDISTLAAGRYTVIVHTAEGIGAKALVVR